MMRTCILGELQLSSEEIIGAPREELHVERLYYYKVIGGLTTTYRIFKEYVVLIKVSRH